MNYQKHYTLLCERAKELEEPEGYFERHHVIPKCLGGSDDPENIVKLTPEEHYLAHQLLVKIHPDHNGLIWAAIQMTGHSTTDNRSNNKIYGWLKRKWSKSSEARLGEKNHSFGTHWYYNPDTLENVKCLPDKVPKGFIKGRKLKPDRPNTKCATCGKDTGSKRRKYCDDHKWSTPSHKSPPAWVVDQSKRYSYSGEDEQKRKERISKSQMGNTNGRKINAPVAQR